MIKTFLNYAICAKKTEEKERQIMEETNKKRKLTKKGHYGKVNLYDYN